MNQSIEILNEYGQLWASWVISGLLGTFLVAVIVSLIWLLLRRRAPASLGCWLFLLVALKLFVPVEVPLPNHLATHVPKWPVEKRVVLKSAPEESVIFITNAGTEDVRVESAEVENAGVPAKWESVLPEIELAEIPVEEVAVSQPVVSVPAEPQRTVPVSLSAWLMLAWALTAFVLFARFLRNEFRFRRLIAGANEVDISIKELAEAMGIRQQKISVRESDRIAIPAVSGFFRPVILLPKEFVETLPENELRWILLHELAHIKRFDLPTALLLRLATILHFFNPSIWFATMQIRRLREYACDDLALAALNCENVQKTGGLALLRVVEHARSLHAPANEALGAFNFKTSLKSRMRRLLDTHRPIRTRLGLGSFLVLLLVAAVALPTLTAQQATVTDAPEADIPEMEATTYKAATDDEPKQKNETATVILAKTESPEVMVKEREELFESGKSDFEAGRFDEAKPFFEKFVEKYPHDDKLQHVLYYLGIIAKENNNPDEAEHYFGQSVGLYPNGARAEASHAGLAWIKTRQNTPEPTEPTNEREVIKETQRRTYENSRTEVEAVGKAWRDGTTTFDQLVDAQIRLIGYETILRICDPETKIEVTKPLPLAEALERYKNRSEALGDPAYRELVARWMNAAEEMLRRQFKTIVEKNPTSNEWDFQKDVCDFLDRAYELYEILGDRPAMQTVLKNQSKMLHQLRQKAISVEVPYFMQLLETRNRITSILNENTSRLTRIVPKGTAQVSTTLEHPLEFWRQRMKLKHKDYLETDIKYLNGAKGGRISDREKARLYWLETRVEYDFFNADLADLRIAALLREESAKNYRQAADVIFKLGVADETVLKEAEMEVAAAAFAPNNLPVQDIAALEKGEPDSNGKPTVLCLKIVRTAGPPTRRASSPWAASPVPAPDKPVIAEAPTMNNYASNPEVPPPALGGDPDYTKLLEKRLAVAKEQAEHVASMFKIGAAGGSAVKMYESQVKYENARVALYRHTGDRDKLLDALRSKSKIVGLKRNALAAAQQSGNAMLSEVTDADLELAEAEYELKHAEKAFSYDAPLEKTITLDFQQRPWQEVLEHLAKQSGMTWSIRNTPITGSFSSTDKRKYTLPEAVEMLNSVLKTRGYSLAQHGNTLVLEAFQPEKESKKALTFQGKTFVQWVEELKTELDPKMRAEAFRALAMFGANGKGKEASAAIVDAVKSISFQRMSAGPPIEEMKNAAASAFADNAIHIPFADSMPLLLKNFAEGTPNEQSFVTQVFQYMRMFHRDKSDELEKFRPKMIDLLKHWEPAEFGDRRFQNLFNLVNDVFPESDIAAEMIREALKNEDEKRFTALFAGFEPMKMAAPSLFKGSSTVCLFGIYPDVAEPDRGTNPVNLKPDDLKHFHITPFGKSLLKLLREKGVTAKNGTIRETSTKIVEALEAVDGNE